MTMDDHEQTSGLTDRRTPLVAGRDGPTAQQRPGLLMTVEQVAQLWFGEVGRRGSASSNCQKIRRLIPGILPARRIGNRWYISRATAEAWVKISDPASVMAHPDTRRALRETAARQRTPHGSPTARDGQ